MALSHADGAHLARDHASDSQESTQDSSVSSTATQNVPGLAGSSTTTTTASQRSDLASIPDYDISGAPIAASPAHHLPPHAVAHARRKAPLSVSTSTSAPMPPSLPAANPQHKTNALASRPTTPTQSDHRSTASSFAPTNDSDASPVSGASSLSPSRGVKRTANGQVKVGDLQLASPIDERHVPYAALAAESPRKLRAKQAIERMQLNLRLAQFKVHHGLQHKSMDEIDEMISAPPTPASAQSTTLDLLSPRSAHAPQHGSRFKGHHRQMSSITSTTDMLRGLHTDARSRRSSLHSDLARPHPILAPPADITRGSTSRPYSRVSTPTPREQDAVESLMKMATPGGAAFR